MEIGDTKELWVIRKGKPFEVFYRNSHIDSFTTDICDALFCENREKLETIASNVLAEDYRAGLLDFVHIKMVVAGISERRSLTHRKPE